MKRIIWVLLLFVGTMAPIACNNTGGLPSISANPSSTTTSTPTIVPATVSTLAGQYHVSGSANGLGTNASFDDPMGLAVDSSGNIYVADNGNSLIREITPAGLVSTLAGQAGITGANNATGTSASFNYPQGVAVDSSGNVYVADTNNQLIRKITPGGIVTTLAGQTGVSGSSNGTGTGASFNNPYGLTVDSSGNVYVADSSNELIRMITPAGLVSTIAGQVEVSGSTNGNGTSATFDLPCAIAVDSSGNLYVADFANYLIRKITSGGTVSTYAGSGTSGTTNGTGTAASFGGPTGITIDSSGNLYVVDNNTNLIRKIAPGGVVTTLTGSTLGGYVNGSVSVAKFQYPYGIAVDSSGDLYVGDSNNELIRKITP